MARTHGVPIIPVAARGVDDAYVGLNDGYRLGKRLRMPADLPVWFGLGPLGLWPVSPPWPVRITTIIGEPIAVAANESDEELNRRVTRRIQRMMEVHA